MRNSAPSEGSDTQKDQTHAGGRWGAIRNWFESNWSQVLFFVVGLALYLLLGLFLWWLLQHYVDPSAIKDKPKRATAKKDLLQALGFIMVGVAGAIGIYFTWRGQQQARQAQEENQRATLEQLEQARNELDLTRRGQITERFTQAIDQLGSKSLEVRLGAVYSLERTAREDRDYHWPIMEVLTTYVRTKAPKKKGEDTEESHPEPDIQAVLTVIGRRSVDHRDVEYGPIDLHTTDLESAVLRKADLSGANLREANLAKANLREANLAKANLRGADLRGADLGRPDFWEPGPHFWGAGADLSGADLSEVDLRGADLSGVDLTEADLRGADLRGADFTQDQLELTIGDESTQHPPGLKRPERWGAKTDEQPEED